MAALSQSVLYELIFKTILGVPQCTGPGGWGCLTGEFAHDFIYALFLPHIVLLLFIYIISRGEMIFQEHRGLGTLFGIGAYIFIIYSGWYTFLASWLVFWMALAIGIAFTYFFLGKFISPAVSGGRRGLGRAVGGYLKKPWEKQKKIEKINKDIEFVKEKIQEAQAKGHDPSNLEEKLQELQMEKRQIQR